jgi:hypothetical protein
MEASMEEGTKERRARVIFAEYTKEETDRLTAAVAKVQPHSRQGPIWEQVKQHFDENAPLHLPPDAPNRTAIGLRDKFSHMATAMIINALSGKPVSINDNSNLVVVETESNGSTESEPVVENESTDPVENEPVDNDTVESAPVYNEPGGDEPVCRESTQSDPHRVNVERPLEESTGRANTNSAALHYDDTQSKPSKAVEATSDDDAMNQEADRLSEAMINFFDRFNPDCYTDDGMIAAGNKCGDAILSRLDTIERNMTMVNTKIGMILSCVQTEEALERAMQWIL